MHYVSTLSPAEKSAAHFRVFIFYTGRRPIIETSTSRHLCWRHSDVYAPLLTCTLRVQSICCCRSSITSFQDWWSEPWAFALNCLNHNFEFSYYNTRVNLKLGVRGIAKEYNVSLAVQHNWIPLLFGEEIERLCRAKLPRRIIGRALTQ